VSVQAVLSALFVKTQPTSTTHASSVHSSLSLQVSGVAITVFVALPLTGRLSKIVPGASSNPVALIWSVMGVFVVLQVIGIVSWNSQVVKSSPLPGTPSLGPRVVSHPGIVEVVPPGNGTVFVMVRFLTP
jgi:hypothetical protein